LEKVIKDISNISGVTSVWIINNNGEVIISGGNTKLEQRILSQTTQDFVQLFGAYELNHQGMNEIEVNYDEGYLFGKAKENFILAILCTNISSLSMIRLTVNVALADLEQNKKFTKLVKDSSHRWNMLRRDSLRPEELALWEIIRK
jgi:hypothetical protein